MLNVKQGGIMYHFWVFVVTKSRIELRSPELLANNIEKGAFGSLSSKVTNFETI